MINIVISMAGKGSRFVNAGYEMPKPLIDVFGHPMIEYVVNNIRPSREHKFIFICQEAHLRQFGLKDMLNKISSGCEIISVDHYTEGAACTVLLAEKYINNDDELMIANSDQYVDYSIDEYVAAIKEKDGLIMTMPADDPKWSFIRFDDNQNVTLVKEKEVISNEATVGIYNFKHGRDFVKYANKMIEKDIRVNNEFYVAPVYNEMIADGKKIGFFNVGSKMYGLGVPEDLKYFMRQDVSRTVFR